MTNISKMGISYVIMVAHRQETLAYADRIVKVNRDKIEFNGTYKELMGKGLIKKVSS
jgi:ABC-type bacteriocin/lantibiotic exporter with double-glycine peptidase domain